MSPTGRPRYLATATRLDDVDGLDIVAVESVDEEGCLLQLDTLTARLDPIPPSARLAYLTEALAARGWEIVDDWCDVDGGPRATVVWSGRQPMNELRGAFTAELLKLVDRAGDLARCLTDDDALRHPWSGHHAQPSAADERGDGVSCSRIPPSAADAHPEGTAAAANQVWAGA